MNNKTIELINAIIVNAELDGADGIYRSNEYELYNIMEKFLIEHSLENKYDIKKIDMSSYEIWGIYQFAPKQKENKL